MFLNNANFTLQNESNKLFVFDETSEKKRKSFSFCAKEDPFKDMNLFQNALGNEGTLNKIMPETKGGI